MIQKRKIVGGLLAAGVAIGVWFSGWIPKFGTGTSGVGTGSAVSTDAGATPANAATKTPGTTAKPDATKKPVDDKSKPATAAKKPTDAEQPTGKVRTNVKGELPDKLPCLDVFVRGSHYQIKDLKGTEMLYIKMDSILSLASRTTGNDEGVRVRILRYRSAKYVPYSQLCEELEKAGFKQDEIRIPHELLDDPVTPAVPTKS